MWLTTGLYTLDIESFKEFLDSLTFCSYKKMADLEAQMFNLAQMFIGNPNVQFSTKPAILPNCS
jgi:hypothetical protein